MSTTIDCDGLCKNGTCMYWCPTVEHEVEYHETGSDTAVLHNNDLDSVYDCQVTWQRDGYDCSDADLVGSYVGVYSLWRVHPRQHRVRHGHTGRAWHSDLHLRLHAGR